ncbi:hypothetical protein N7449_010698 [Penicillium cf. viridicatum]|uniref:Uncharacterized protein n=1 Tax=Penicillium cf. viridicatum TaxID=2972119 RepID=A0A9W9M3T6_9EURO|nr:hypothetical protein N7449_010698 [Penicillium cf. viridicatum]
MGWYITVQAICAPSAQMGNINILDQTACAGMNTAIITSYVRVHHVDRSKDGPILRQALAQRPMGSARGRNRRLNPNGGPGIVSAQTPVQSPPSQFSPSEGPGQDSNSSSLVKIEFFPRIPAGYSDASETRALNTSNDQSLPSIHEALGGLSNFAPSPIGASSFLQRAEKTASPNQATMNHASFSHPPSDKTLELVLEWMNLTREEILQS